MAKVAEQRGNNPDALQYYEKAASNYKEWLAHYDSAAERTARLGAMLDKAAALRWILFKQRVIEPPSLRFLRSFDGQPDENRFAARQRDRAWATLAEGQIKAGDLQDARVSLEHALGVYRTMFLTRPESSLDCPASAGNGKGAQPLR